MKQDFLAAFTGNQNTARVLRTLILNEGERFTIKELGKRAGISNDSAQTALEHLKEMQVVRFVSVSTPVAGKKKEHAEKAWFVNESFEYLKPLVRFVREISPVRYEEIVDALKRTGKLSTVVLSGSFMGDESRPADMLVAADSLNEQRLETAVKQLEPMFGKEIRYAVFSTPEFRYRMTVSDKLLRDTFDFPHLVLLDNSGML
jgi:hypothetical protein